MIDRTARMRGILGSAGMMPRARRICKNQARRRSRVAARMEVLQYDHSVEMDFGKQDCSTWTVLNPMSGKYHTRIYLIEADEELAIRVYAARNGGRHPEKVSCDCGCGADYFVSALEGSLSEVTAMVRNCPSRGERFVEGRKLDAPGNWDYHTLEQFLCRTDVTLIRSEDIAKEEATFPMPTATYPSMYSEDEQTTAWLLDIEM
ncbi:MAG: hypothetical protein SGJ27_27215 [Candidatus Melainabacteria bacterium]|nr:hypothetical protein [Candidatus Melainabacteria bacterium]